MIGLVCLLYNKCNYFIFEINNEILNPLLSDIIFLAID